IRADVYSLGCTAYFLLTGQPPFAGCSLAEKLVRHQMKEPTPVEQVRKDVPAAVAAVVREMMAKQPADRDQTPGGAAEALRTFAKDDSVETEARPQERRRSERHACAVAVRFQLPLHVNETPHAATAVDVSKGGVRLQSDQQFKPGAILSLVFHPPGHPAW